MADVDPLAEFTAATATSIGNSLAVLRDNAQMLPQDPIPYVRLVEGLSESVYDVYKMESPQPGSTEADPSLIEKEFKKVGVPPPHKNRQSSPAERAIESAMMSIVEYAALVSKAKLRITSSLKMMKLLRHQGNDLINKIKAAGR